MILVALHAVAVAVVPLNLTVLVPCAAPKFVPVITTDEPTAPEVGFSVVIVGAGVVTVKLTPLLACVPTVTTTLPVVAPLGTVTAMLVLLHEVTVAVVPLNLTVLAPCVVPKFVPVIVTAEPAKPEVGLRLVIAGAGTVKLTPLLAKPPTVTTTVPVAAPAGTVTLMLVALQLVVVATVPPKVTVLVPCVVPKFVPVMVTAVPGAPEFGLTVAIVGPAVEIVNITPGLDRVPTVTMTLPVVAPAGTVTLMLVALHALAVAVVPLNLTVLVPCVAPKFIPVIVTCVPTAPELGFKLLIVGPTVNATPLLACVPTVTTTFPVVAPAGTVTLMLVALQFVAVATVPLNITVLVPCVPPKFVPVIVTAVPTAPELGFRLVIPGAGAVTVKVTPLLACVPTVTTTFPVIAPAGTVTAILVSLQLVAVAVVPLNLTVLVPWVAPKFVPVIVTAVPTGPDVGFRLVIAGAGVVTVNVTPLLACVPTVTTTLPVAAPVGTVTTMLVALQLVTPAAFVPNVTVLVPCVDPKLLPVIVTDVPTAPDVGFRLAILGTSVEFPGVELEAQPYTETAINTTQRILSQTSLHTPTFIFREPPKSPIHPQLRM